MTVEEGKSLKVIKLIEHAIKIDGFSFNQFIISLSCICYSANSTIAISFKVRIALIKLKLISNVLLRI